MGVLFYAIFEDLLHLLTLKLSAVILAPAGTVYMLLGDKGNDGDNSIVTKLITRRVRIARRLVAKISPHHALPNRSPVGIPRGGRHCFSWILLSWASSGCRFDLLHRSFPPVRFSRNFSRRKIPA